ncbi:hypothetical protein NK214_13655 [Chromobacterium sp. S0633]|uniref:hypothetical protein n=1 Tax=unclassified Chromobacterium TaxID=2641838 RepID=UPI0011B2745A|nr:MULTISPECIES: hypothetical protein [unclassified Chromobacterium]MCP1291240.1 hypothetical protein [Chromobacterium sp. S0633]
MKHILIFVMILSSNTYGGALTNKDVKRFVENAEICQHLVGEVSETSDMTMINDANKACEQAKKQRKRLLKKYSKDREVIKIIREFDETLAPKY